jgi:hypothetical protein
MHVAGFNFVSVRFSVVSVRLNYQLSVSIVVFSFLGLLISSIPSYCYVSLSVLSYAPWSKGGCLSSAKLRSTDSVNPRAVLSRVRPRYRPLL